MRLFSDRGVITVSAAVAIFCLLIAFAWLFFRSPYGRISYTIPIVTEVLPDQVAQVAAPAIPAVIHITTPESLKAVYLTSWAAGNAKFRREMNDLVDNTEINAIVIDIKDYSGKISFEVDDPILQSFGATERRIPDIKEYIAGLHDKGVYVIGRISSFQDSFLVKSHPEWAVKTESGEVWQDYKGVKWLDPGAQPVWDYLIRIGWQSYEYGFDELNFDYIRYPSDGNMQDIRYDWSDGRTRQEVMRSFFMYLREAFATSSIPLSVDLFGLTTSAEGDLGIGQNLEDALMYFDYVCPMIYPSHFAKGFIGYAKPAEHPYEVIKYSLDQALVKVYNASSTPEKIRPWLQSFDLGATYTPALIRAQIQATYDSGLPSWMLWHAGSVYNKESLVPKSEMGSTTQS